MRLTPRMPAVTVADRRRFQRQIECSAYLRGTKGREGLLVVDVEFAEEPSARQWRAIELAEKVASILESGRARHFLAAEVRLEVRRIGIGIEYVRIVSGPQTAAELTWRDIHGAVAVRKWGNHVGRQCRGWPLPLC